jgi:hypothetical protein
MSLGNSSPLVLNKSECSNAKAARFGQLAICNFIDNAKKEKNISLKKELEKLWQARASNDAE